MKFLVVIYLMINILFAQSNEFIFSQLYIPYGWVQINNSRNQNDSPSIYTKEIFGADYQALMIKDTISAESKKIINIINNVESYDNIFTSSKLVSTSVISRKNNFVDAYQHLPVPIPFISDRHYIFRMNGFENRSNVVRWILLNRKDSEYSNYISQKEDSLSSVIYLDTGVGIWEVNKLESNISEISYRLYMDTGGRLPKFLVEWLNKTAVNNVFTDIKNASLN
ncbi:MAG: hypothetical protein CMF98_02030 [Candidatus Marinimicrobia bacterium]|nr:hypothetical protein [Candidatus Neomarinimicrobiota bacterium]OUW50780.1 MAG: hypothetical protein CBD50_00625 [bacterium TMED190]|tara:strand:+ start:59824 stop:60495 length:672 start_codon:yes stop_codon:yes gene_type:complete